MSFEDDFKKLVKDKTPDDVAFGNCEKYYFENQILRHCLSKQKVRDAITKLQSECHPHGEWASGYIVALSELQNELFNKEEK